MKKRSTLVAKEGGSGVVAVTVICFHISDLCCDNPSTIFFVFCITVPFSLLYWSYLYQWKPSYARLTSKDDHYLSSVKGRFQETATARAEAKPTTHVVCLARVLTSILD